MKYGLQMVPLKLIQHKRWRDSEMRVIMNNKKIEQYAKEKLNGANFPEPVLFFDHDERFWVGDGFHRLEADSKNGLTKISADVRPGTIKDAILMNLRANRESQGLPFGPGDITKSIKYLLTNRLFQGWTRKKIAESVGCTEGMVSKVALKIGLPRSPTGRRPIVNNMEVVRMLAAGMSHEEVARKLGVSVRTTYRREISSKFSPCLACHGSGKVLKI